MSIANVSIRIGADTAGAVREIQNVNKALGEQMTTGQKASASLKKAALPAAAAFGVVAGVIGGATQAASEDADAQLKLAGALERTTGATKEQVAQSEDFISNLSQQVAIADDELRPALAKLAAASGSVEKGQRDLAVAADIAAQAGVPLAKAAQAVANAERGRTGALEKLVPSIKETTLATKDANAIIGEAAKLTKGAGAEAAGTYAGQQKAIQIATAEATEELGSAFLPIQKEVMTIVARATRVLTEHVDLLRILLVVVGAVAGAVLVANAATKAWQAAQTIANAATKVWAASQWLLNAALNANPISLVVIAIAALTAGIILAYKNSDTFRGIVDRLFDVIVSGIKVAITPYRVALEALEDVLRAFIPWLRDTATVVWRTFGTIIDTAGDVLRALTGWITNTGKIVWTTFADAIAGVGAAIRAGVEWLRDNALVVWGRFRDALDMAKQRAGELAGVIQARVQPILEAYLAVLRKIVGFVKSLVEWIAKIDWPDPPDWLKKAGGLLGKIPGSPFAAPPAPAVAGRRGGAAPRASSSSTGLTVQVFGSLIDPEGAARALRRVLEDHDRRQGRIA